MLGTTLGRYDGEGFVDNRMTAFGETLSGSEGSAPAEALRFFTGKPEVEGLGYAFLLRNYRANFGKWQTSDPLGYPDGWNNLAYVNNWVTVAIDYQGTFTMLVGAVVGGVIGGVSGYIAGDGSFTSTMAGTIGGVVGGVLTGSGIPCGSAIGGAVSAGLTTALNRYLDDGSLSKSDLGDIAVASTVGAVASTIAGQYANDIVGGIENIYAGNISQAALDIINGFSAGVVAEMGNIAAGLTLDLLHKIENFVNNNRQVFE